jgi:hypothetical protein
MDKFGRLVKLFNATDMPLSHDKTPTMILEIYKLSQ